ncbi:FAD-dependent monooxygenase [Blastomonas fulva]|uniref:FAD-dependent monooxygenase n=1 Tax=Blastomonas fulva TaxID=1550728 RepID=UPI0025A3BCA6|nr:FAD-dependent monooxygenase [Blastomonas fulva]MDM7928823.1 FAD-dependent monooxygenase [Blastomonas fulva]MDM7964609.1 FAD-dependent monooxygenase [Blastomonas fulva]
MSNTPALETDVLIVGAGPVGLALAVALGLGGIRVLMVERDGSRGPQPRAKTLNMRSLEHLRRWGMADAIRKASPRPDDLPTDIVFQTRLYGHHIATLPNIYFRGNSHADDARFSEPSEWIPQYKVEEVMKARLNEIRTVEQRYGSELLGFKQDDGGVDAEIRSACGAKQSVRCKFIVGADGGASRVRDIIGGRLEGRYAYACNFNMVLRIPELNQNPPKHRGIMHWLINEDSPGIMGPIGDLWYVAKKLPRGSSGMTEAEIAHYLEGIIGKQVDFEIMALDPWYAHELISDRYRNGRAFIVGDACQLRPPFGGYGMNMGIGDAGNLAWKLEAVIRGWGGESLLDSYEYERRQVHRWTIEEAVANYAVLSADLLRGDLEADNAAGAAAREALGRDAIEQKRSEFHTIGLVLGYHYGGSPVIAGGADLPAPHAEHYDPVAAPGKLAPHVWVAPGVSLYDQFGEGMTLLTKEPQSQVIASFSAVAHSLGIPLEIVAIPSDAGALFPCAFALVRPDEHVAWQADYADVEVAYHALKLCAGIR